MMRLLPLLVPCCAAAAATPAAAASAVADCGADPAGALPAAVAALRKARGGSVAAQATLTVRGLCRLAAPLQLGAADSNVEWVGDGGAATISGGISVPGSAWSAHAKAQCAGCGTVWVASLGTGAVDSRQFYVDGVRANRTVMSFPQHGATKHARGFDTALAGRFTHNGGAKIELIHRGTYTCNYSSWQQWAETRVPVAATTASTFAMVEPAYSHSNNNGNLLPCFLENAYELLGDATHGHTGDFYLDITTAAASKIYFVGPSAPQQAVLPQSQGLVNATHTSDWSVRGLAMQEATWLLDDSGFMQAQSGTYVHGPACGTFNTSAASGRNNTACPYSSQTYMGTPNTMGCGQWDILPAAVHVHGGARVRFSNCTFQRLGATAVTFDRGSQNCSIAASLIRDVSGNGIQIGACMRPISN